MMLRPIRFLHGRRITLPLVWDVVMVYLALLNVGLILFDMTYLQLRPVYFRWLPVIVRVYDPVKGIQPHPLTEAVLEQAEATRRRLAAGADAAALEPHAAALTRLTLAMLEEDPFVRSGQGRNLEIMKLHMAEAVTGEAELPARAGAMTAIVERFFSAEPSALGRDLAVFERRIEPLLAVNYHRGYGLDGQLEDHFWKLDLPFLILFWIEFAARWWLSLRRRQYPKWFFFPIVHWYDLLGLMPFRQFRFFRLFRVASIYIRLRRSELSGVGQDLVSRTVAYFSNIITEEISDLVAVRILTEVQEELRDGTHMRILESTFSHRREALEGLVVAQVRDALANAGTQDRLRRLYAVALDNAAAADGALRGIPLPAAVVRPLVKVIGQLVFEAVLETVDATLRSQDGQRALRRVVAGLLDDVLSGPGTSELEALGREAALELLEHMKEAVAVKKWMGSDLQLRAPSAEAPEDIRG